MSISTKRGDDGSTSLLFGKRVPKNHPRVMTYGRVDELNSALGLCRAHAKNDSIREQILEIQKDLVVMMCELATDDADRGKLSEKYQGKLIDLSKVDTLTNLVDEFESSKGGFKGWSYPGNTVADAFFDQARTTCRRCERGLVTLRDSGAAVRPELIHYLNRLADLLWLWGREHS
ncbi:cob(I)yrinic acid a,c-diamide adenosyltransferase [Coraliomargarita sinensis]|uniref:Corrinoid adenosyltransferase n=1 Tax=Coraliomargarita sinensis TaxID=2174842 RepID=A0A317ZF92_9BACT|nr:cob(I)yrinic acid a,c-diamide adenosyltransferase [Coraliomargarita sinensis]PXA04195.1 cob(I)yrinic acid a,c-diamide adenosyltransferase [Coraliomargarita sinensis]